MNLKIKISLLLLCTQHSITAYSNQWDVYNDPSRFEENYQRVFDLLPLNAIMQGEKMPWSEDYWPDYKNGVAVRWYRRETNEFDSDYKTNSSKDILENLKRFPNFIARLSASEKLDIYLGNKLDGKVLGLNSYPITNKIKKQSKDRGEERQWEGICNGWSAAATNHPEPIAYTAEAQINGETVQVPFGASDIKALLSYAYTSRSGMGYNEAVQIGGRCGISSENYNPNLPAPTCEDVNAGAFHMVIANQIALLQQSFVLDVDSGMEVWNQPVAGYESQVLNSNEAIYVGAARGTARVVRVRTTLKYVSEIKPQFEAVVGTSKQNIEIAQYEYLLDLNTQGEIIGGKWISSYNKKTNRWENENLKKSYQHPDFLWKTRPAPFTKVGAYGTWARFYQEIYLPSVASKVAH